MSKIGGSVLALVIAVFFQRAALASYVLPYPSLMPENKLYTLMRLFDEAKRYWYWGNIASYRYLLGQSDKALVEAKTLFAYGQYLLALAALDRSNGYIQKIPDVLWKARQEGKEISKYEREYREAKAYHTEVLEALMKEVPEEFTWQPQRGPSTVLPIREEILKAIQLRK